MKVGVLGPDGITGQAVIACLHRLDGWQYTPDLDDAELVVASPGIAPKDYPELAVDIISEIEFAWRLFRREESTYQPKIVGITGTNGKSTITALCANVLGAEVAGNFGVPLVTFVDCSNCADIIVVELSSYQLERCFEFAPDVAVITNVTPDHLARHGTMALYAEAKGRLLQAMAPAAPVFFVPDGGLLDGVVQRAKVRACAIRLPDPPINTVLVGPFNQLNCAIVREVGRHFGVFENVIHDRIAAFSPLPHRLERVRELNGRLFVNDSKGTNPDATLNAVRAFDVAPHLILCGVDKQLDLAPFFSALESMVASVCVYGGLSEMVAAHFESCATQFYKATDLNDALAHLLAVSRAGDVILFSPSSASFDMYKDFEARGEAFCEAVHALI
ncbi:MAG: UDP-N-acetylmuramoyl-L-alanine--D-glutamate ligase [bacterium]|nr:UDP-N-acetylmuramoyl-L-alanine--D-glutamate ligase [bacterium]